MGKLVIDKIDIELYKDEARKIVDLIVEKERKRSIRNGKYSHYDSRFVLMFLASCASEQILFQMISRISNAEQKKLKQEFSLDDEFAKT